MASTGSPRFLLRPAADADREMALDLLEAAGWTRPLLRDWAAAGTVLELYDPAEDEPQGAAIVDTLDDATYELRAWVSTVDTAAPSTPGRLVTAIADALRRGGGRRVVASVGDADPQRLTLLLAAGFRFAGVERDSPFASGGRPGDRSRDLVWMDQDL
jgi:hypothetical protein